jgi:hypothetical protein
MYCTEVLYIPKCPHNLIALGRLLLSGYEISLRAKDRPSSIFTPSGEEIFLHNRSVLVIPLAPTPSLFQGVLASDTEVTGQFAKPRSMLDTVVQSDTYRNQSSPPVKFAHWFSGEAHDESLSSYCLQHGAATAFDFDTVVGGAAHDLSNDSVFAAALSDIDANRIHISVFRVAQCL